mgnify:CR=1 FL=1
MASPTRGITAGDQGYSPYAGAGSANRSIEFITFSTRGNGTHFGELTSSTSNEVRSGASCSSNTRGVFAGSRTADPSPANVNNIIEYITIATLGNAASFGDGTVNRAAGAACSDSHGGLG